MTRRNAKPTGRGGLLCSVGDHSFPEPLTTQGLKRLHAVEPGEHYTLCGTGTGDLTRHRWHAQHEPERRQRLKDSGYRFCRQCTRLARLRDAARAEAILLARITSS